MVCLTSKVVGTLKAIADYVITCDYLAILLSRVNATEKYRSCKAAPQHSPWSQKAPELLTNSWTVLRMVSYSMSLHLAAETPNFNDPAL